MGGLRTHRAIAASIAVIATLGLAPDARAVVHMVNSLGDAGDASDGDQVCDTGGTVLVGGSPVPECTFRAALEQDAISSDQIDFSSEALIPDVYGRFVISPQSPLPSIDHTVSIYGSTAVGYDVNDPWALPVVVLDGSALASGDGLVFAGGGQSVVRSLAIVGFPGHGIQLGHLSDDILIQGCHIGVDPRGIAAGNGGDGIRTSGSTQETLIGQSCTPPGCSGLGNVISGNGGDGVSLAGDDHIVAGNRIGTTVAGTAALPNLGYGIAVRSGSDTRIGDSGLNATRSGNLVSGNALGGVYLAGEDSRVHFSQIGIDTTATSPIPNGGPGVLVVGNGSRISLNEIRFNLGAGVWVQSGESNNVFLEDIRDNQGLPIDLGPAGPTPNDPLDVDTGANRLMNSPSIDPVESFYDTASEWLHIVYYIDTALSEALFPLEADFYSLSEDGEATRVADDLFYGDSMLYVSVGVMTSDFSAGDVLVATTTDNFGNRGSTSEVSTATEIPEPSPILGLFLGAGLLSALSRSRTRRRC